MTERRRLLSTADGTSAAAFGPVEWSLMLATAMMWGSSFVLIAVGLETLHPTVITLGRVALGALAISLIPRARRPVDREDYPGLALIGLVWIAIPFLLFPIAQQWVDSSIAGLINGSMPIWAGTIAAILLRRRPGPLQAAGLVVGFIGVTVITVQSVRVGGQSLFGVVLLVLAAMCYGLAVNLTVPLVQKYGSLAVIVRAQAAALIALIPIGLWGVQYSTATWGGFAAIAFLGVLSSGFALVFMGELARRTGATRASVTIYIVPVVSVILGAALRDERITVLTLFGGGLVLLGAWSTSRAERARGEVNPPTAPRTTQ
ncbi:MAG: DMT family transporter [Acidimicrobiia bacterium]